MPRVVDFAQELNKLLDVETPWTFMLHDRTGLSEIRPDEDVEIKLGGQAEEDPEEQVQPLAFLVSSLLLMAHTLHTHFCHAHFCHAHFCHASEVARTLLPRQCL